MGDLERELSFHRQQCDMLGKRILQLQGENTRIVRDLKRSRLLIRLIIEAHEQANKLSSVDEVAMMVLKTILGTLNVDCAAIFTSDPGENILKVNYALGFQGAGPETIAFLDRPVEFYFKNSRTSGELPNGHFERIVDVPYFLWSFSPENSTALLLGNYSEDQRLHPAFGETDREIVDGALKVFLEIAKRNRIEESLRQSEEKYRIITENISDIVWTMNMGEDPRPTYVSPSVEIILGYSVEEALSLPIHKILTSDSYEKMKDTIEAILTMDRQEVIREKWPITLEVELRHRDGSIVMCETTNLPILNKARQPIGLIGVTRDIGERKKFEEELIKARDEAEQANKTKSDFLANMSHELRTPLNHIIGFTELVVDKNFGDLNEVQSEYMNDVLTSSRHLLSLINDILDLSKVEAGKMELDLSEFSIRELLDNSMVMIQENAMKHALRLLKDFDGIPESIQGDQRKLKQVLYNLLSNAVKFTFDGGEIRLMARANPEWRLGDEKNQEREKRRHFPIAQSAIEISVSDTGIGLSPQDMEKIFDPFDQVENSASRRYPGTGLGLSLTKTLIELHGGRIWAESAGQGKGSVFRFIIPTQFETAS